MVGDLVAEAALDVAVDAVVGDVELAADEPLGERQVPLERRVEGSTQSMRSRASRAQNASKSASASAYSSAVALACAANAGSGGNVRSSARRFSISGDGVGDGSTLTEPLLSESSAGRAILPRPAAPARAGVARPSVGADSVVVGEVVLESAAGEAGRGQAGRVARQDDALRPRDLDAVRLEGGEQPLAELAAGGPLLGRPDRARGS